MKLTHDYVNTLQCRVKSLTEQLRKFKSGEKYLSIQHEFQKVLDIKDGIIRALEIRIAEANASLVTMRENWMQVYEDLQKGFSREAAAYEARIKKLFDRARKAEAKVDELLDCKRELLSELYAVKTELEEEKEKRARLVTQLNRNHENSSIPSSQKPNRKKIANSREKTDKKQGAQPGHEGHGRKRQEPDEVVHLSYPDYGNDAEYYPTGKIIKKQLVNIVVTPHTIEYYAIEYRHRKTGNRVYAEFPKGVVNDVNYGGSIKALAFLLNTQYNVSLDNTIALISELTDGKIEISRGMVNGLTKEFTLRTENEQLEIFAELLSSSNMGVDFTGVKVNGKQSQVLVCGNESTHMFYARAKKGHEGVKGTPLEHHQGTLMHDHDITFYSYGKLHQECLVHILRYLIGSMENEKNRTWNKRMWELIREMIHHRNSLSDGEEIESEQACDFENRYIEILETAKTEYEYEPASKYYMDGFNLQKRLYEYKDSYLLFLYDSSVPTNNNLCERLLRQLKRKLRQMMTFRSFESLEYYCTSLGLLGMLRRENKNLYRSVSEIF
jgi:hypothetical protein